MATQRLARLALLCTTLVLSACGSGAATPPADPFGAIDARVATTPSGVVAVLVTVTGAGIAGDLRTELTRDAGGHWSGRVLNVPPGLGRVVTAYAYDRAQVPADPVAVTTGLVYRGTRTNVAVTAGQLASVPVLLLPWPDGGGGTGLNTPPHLTSVTHAAAIDGGATTTFTATALDPDDGAFLTYAWSDDAGGTFSPPGGAIANQVPGAAAAIDWTPPPALVGTVTISLSVSDGIAAATTSFQLAVGSGVGVGIQFDLLPEIAFTGVESQLLLTGDTSRIDYELAYPAGAGPDAPQLLEGTARWTDSCGGTFAGPETPYFIPFFVPPQPASVTYTAPAVAPAAGVPCELRLTLTDALGAATWSSVMVWVDQGAASAADFTGAWTGPIAAPGDPANTFNLRMDLAQSNGAVSGTFDIGWAVTGTVSGSTLTFHATQNTASCNGTIDGTATADGGSTTMAVAFTGENVCFGGPMTFAYEGTLTRYAASAMVVFATTTQVDGAAFGGSASAADAFCQAEADVGIQIGLTPPGTYAALLSFPGRNAGALIVDVPYFLPDGTVVAGGRSEFLGGTLRHAIDINQNRSNNVGPLVWTGSLPDGTYDAIQGQCFGWTTNASVPGTVGLATSADSGWSTYAAGACDQPASVYCVQNLVGHHPGPATPEPVGGAGAQSKLRRTAARRVFAPILARTRSTCFCTVRGLMPRAAAISWSSFPSRSQCSTSASRAVSPAALAAAASDSARSACTSARARRSPALASESWAVRSATSASSEWVRSTSSCIG